MGRTNSIFDSLSVSPRHKRSVSARPHSKTSVRLNPWRFVTRCLFGSAESIPMCSSDYQNCSSTNLNCTINHFSPNFDRERLPSRSSAEKMPFFVQSQFSQVPPTICFYLNDKKGPITTNQFGSHFNLYSVKKPKQSIRHNLRWCYNSLIPKVVRKCLATNHFLIVDEKLFWIGYWGRHLKSSAYRHILPYQKVNHFPGAFHIGRKDRLWGHISQMATRWSPDHFDLMPYTYVLPRDARILKAAMSLHTVRHLILKPPASARGTGIKIVHRWEQIPKRTPLIAQHYVDCPYLINDFKFDLRLYVYITSMNPLRTYIYEDGLVRFASVRYSNSSSSLSNRFMHLTNYSINKTTTAADNSYRVDKWSGNRLRWRLFALNSRTVRQLWKYLQAKGHDVDWLMQQIIDLVLKTILSCELAMTEHTETHCAYPFACHELFGFDILLDSNLRPWLLEANISPSLHSGTQLDRDVKERLARDVLNLAGLRMPPDKLEGNFDYRVQPRDGYLTCDERDKRRRFEHECENRSDLSILNDLTPGDVRLLILMEDEWTRRGGFARIFPTQVTGRYLKYLTPRYGNLLQDAWIRRFGHQLERGLLLLETLCFRGLHLMGDDDSLDSQRVQ